MQVIVARLSKHLRKDLLELGKEVFEDEGDEIAPSVIRDLLEQVSEISRRYLEIRTKMDEEPKIAPIGLREFDPTTMSYRTLTFPIPLYLNKLKKKLLILQDEVRDKRREKENHEKILLTKGLKLGPGCLKLLDLEDHSLILPYQDR